MRTAWLLAVVVVSGCGGPGEVPAPDAAADGSAGCARDEECDDGAFCTGEELCLPRSPLADARGCVAGGAACGVGTVCDETADRCALDCSIEQDADGDGVDSPDCGGEDCDDADADVHPGAVEVCDPDGIDEDCDPTTFGERDLDSDGYLDARCCNGAGTAAEACGDDCADEDATRHPTEAETCNELDDDCDGATDEGGVTTHFVRDADRDGHGDDDPAAESIDACRAPSGYATRADDCDDAIASVHPGAYDRCDAEGVDDDCSGTPNDPPGGCDCATGATRPCPLLGACGASTQTCTDGVWPAECPIAPSDEVCGNGLDEDCDGAADDGCVCTETVRFCGTDEGACMRGIQMCTTDGTWTACLDAIDPVPETCNDVDDDCDGTVDEGFVHRCFSDADSDGYAVPTSTVMDVCAPACPSGWTARDPADPALRDCDPADARVHPMSSAYGTPRTGGGFDYDCDGASEVVSVPIGGCSQRADGTCAYEGTGLRTVSSCGARTDLLACTTFRSGSGPPECLEMIVCSSSTDCGDDNRTRCQ